MTKKKTFRVYSISNASEAYFPHNKLTEFSHYLPNQLTLDPALTWSVAVRSVGIHVSVKTVPCPKDQPSLYYVGASQHIEALEKIANTQEVWGPRALTFSSDNYEPEQLAFQIQEFFKRNQRIRRVQCRLEGSGRQQFVLFNPQIFPTVLLMPKRRLRVYQNSKFHKN